MDRNEEIYGDQVLMITPFDKEGNIDEESTKKHIEHLIRGGLHGILALGSTGEFFSMTTEERKKFMSLVTEIVDNRIPVGFCVGHSGTSISSDLAKHAEKVGASYVLVTPPYYFIHDGNGIFQHISSISSSIKIPVMVYDGAGGTEISIDLLKSLKKVNDNIKFVKVATRSPGKVRKIRELFGDDLIPFCGDESMALMELADGAGGFTLGAGNVQPHITSKIFNLYKEGELDSAICYPETGSGHETSSALTHPISP